VKADLYKNSEQTAQIPRKPKKKKAVASTARQKH
jgi:hypothetical protein